MDVVVIRHSVQLISELPRSNHHPFVREALLTARGFVLLSQVLVTPGPAAATRAGQNCVMSVFLEGPAAATRASENFVLLSQVLVTPSPAAATRAGQSLERGPILLQIFRQRVRQLGCKDMRQSTLFRKTFAAELGGVYRKLMWSMFKYTKSPIPQP